jgi:hypothetical protein
MSITRFASAVGAFATAMVLASTVHAQLFKPFEFPPIESDFQFFAPAEVETFGGGPKGKTGWFATYDRCYINVQRPHNPSPYQVTDKYGDFTWGNRWDFGYVGEDRKGWWGIFWHIDGPNENNVQLVERINRFVEDASPLGEDNAVVNPWRDNNLRLTGDRDYLVYNSINVADLTGFELNRTWLKKPLMHGARLTPFGGFRYIRFVDFFQRDQYLRYDDFGNLLPPLSPPLTALAATTEELSSFQTGFTNDMVGGQLGIRWDKDYRRWNFSGDVKALALQNFQVFNEVLKVDRTIYGDTVPADDAPTTVVFEERGEGAHRQEFVYGFEIRAEAAFRVTRDLSLRVGFELLDLVQGIGRGSNPNYNEQDVLLYGVTFGGTYNR